MGASSSLAQRTRIAEWTAGKPHWRSATFGPASATGGLEESAWCEGALSARDIAKHRGAMKINVAVRTPAGALLA